MLQAYATREADELSKKNFVRLLTFIFNMPSKMNQLSFAREAFAL